MKLLKFPLGVAGTIVGGVCLVLVVEAVLTEAAIRVLKRRLLESPLGDLNSIMEGLDFDVLELSHPTD